MNGAVVNREMPRGNGPILVDGIFQLAEAQPGSVADVLLQIEADEEASGYVPHSIEEVQAPLQAMDDEWDERDREIEAIHALRQVDRAVESKGEENTEEG